MVHIDYLDEQVVVCRKAAGLLSEGEGEMALPTLLARTLGERGETDTRLFVVHRLDKETEGLMVYARTSSAAAGLSAAIAAGSMEKEYLAVENKAFLEKVNDRSVTKLVASLFDSHSISEADLDELAAFIRSKTGGE